MIRRFVILEHDHPFLHWDFLLDVGETQQLKTWRLLASPATGIWITAEALPDHRRVYLDYEGEVSGDRGTVKQILSGQYQKSSGTADDERRFAITSCSFCELAIHRLKQDGSPEWRFE